MDYNYIPKYIRQSETKRSKDVITATRWNELFNLLIEQGDYTAEELGNILNYFTGVITDLANEFIDFASDAETAIAYLRADKQDKLIAGEGVTIAADGKTISASGGGGIPEAPTDGKQYARKDGEWSEVEGGGYEPPVGGIPKTDLASDVQASLGKADTALQPSDTVESEEVELADVATSGDYNDLINKPTLFSGNYNDLTNKPTIPTVPTNVSAFTNDSGYLTLATLPIYDGSVV